MKRLAAWLVRSVLVLLVAFAALWTFWALDMGLLGEAGPLPPNIGNGEAVRAQVPGISPAEPFSFAVVGDLRADETFDAMAAELRGQKLAFLALAGDITRDPTEADHRFISFKMRERWRLPFPVFCLPGNHDVSPGTYPLERFERTYGETNFTVARGPYRFIFSRMLPGDEDNSESIRFLERELEEATAAGATAMVIGHSAPKVSSFVGGREFSGEKELVDLLAKHRVRAYIHGDFHGYVRTTVGPTTYLCVGGGGANLRQPGAFAFHHVAVISLEGSGAGAGGSGGAGRSGGGGAASDNAAGGHMVERLIVMPAKWRADERGRYLAAFAFERFGALALVVPLGVGLAALAGLGLTFRGSRA